MSFPRVVFSFPPPARGESKREHAGAIFGLFVAAGGRRSVAGRRSSVVGRRSSVVGRSVDHVDGRAASSPQGEAPQER